MLEHCRVPIKNTSKFVLLNYSQDSTWVKQCLLVKYCMFCRDVGSIREQGQRMEGQQDGAHRMEDTEKRTQDGGHRMEETGWRTQDGGHRMEETG